MKIGPVTLLDVEQLEHLFKTQGISFEKLVDESAIDEIDQANRERSPSQNVPRFDGPKAIVIYDIPDQSIESVRPTLEKLGYWHQGSDGSELDGEDYLCPKCDHYSHVMGICPTHKVPLVVLDEWNRLRSANESEKQKITIVVTIVLLGLFWFFAK